ncbi:nicotinate-nucleotide--dimethylbenzimidazole phosphoribosyltransferase [Propionimicrobium lymphophilum]|uniref:nicotinate-nucleotide--dimethylbenzimidazole phosphoribosyltransferase n=1 Tax=Propionimicrobium lymphophilum TaxID=33012 RepID=UPI00288C4A95|nr:nicotinate-nucleotide--dimethylbenzimidazole phosphoribosyltransferase [Propionimicrobium lymphophilum]
MTELFHKTIKQIVPVDEDVRARAVKFHANLTKPPTSLGYLEVVGEQLSAISGQCPPPLPLPARTCVFAGDHGVQAQKVSPWPQTVTEQMGTNIARGGAAINALSRHAGADVVVYNVGGLTKLPESETCIDCRIAPGTKDMTQGPAMSEKEAYQALEIGIKAAKDAVDAGKKCLIAGELGIANTTPAAALIRVFTGAGIAEVTGRGSGADDEMLERKKSVIATAIAVNGATKKKPIEALAAIGGFEHAAMAGLMLGAAAAKVPIIVDGVIACSAALVAAAICPDVLGYMIAGHDGEEPGIRAALDNLGLRALLKLDLSLGEGSGAAAALPLVTVAAKIMNEMAIFGEESGVSGEKEN